MKPNADMITKILSDLRVNGKVAQDRLLIGKGSDEVLTFGSGNLKVRYTPQVTGGRTFTVLGSSNHDVYDEVVVLKPYPKPSNSFIAQWVLPASDTIWISDNLQDPNYSSWRLIMFVGRTNAASGNVPTRWALKTVVNGSGAYGIDWATSNVQDFLGVDTNITWSNGEASSYPTSVSGWSTDGSLAKQPEQFSMSNVEGSIQKLEYTTDGSTWHALGEASSGATVVYEPIEFDASHLSNDGKITIQHNFNDKNVLCLGYTPQPKEIEYLDNQIVLDYSDQNSSNLSGAVWFVNSKQEMLVVPVAPEILTVTGAGSSDVNGTYNLVAESEWSSCISDEDLAGVTSGSAYLNENRDYVLFDKTTAASRTITFMTHKDLGSNPLYRADDVASGDATTATFTVVNGASPAPTVTVGGGVADPEEPSGQVKVSGAGISDAEGIYTLTSGSASEPLEYTKEGTGWIIIRTMGYDPIHTHVYWSIRNTNTNAYAYASESFGGTEVKYPWELTWVMDPDGAEPVPTVEQYTPTSVVLPSPSIRISNCGVEEANGDYSIIPEQYWDQYVDPTYLQNHTIVQLWTNGTGVLETNGAEPYIYPVGSDPSKVDPWYAGVVSTDPNDPLTVSVWITLDNGIAPVPTLEAI